MQIRRIQAQNIDSQRWDAFIQSSKEGMVYALHGFLTNIDPGWEAYILSNVNENNWQMVFPFTAKKKYGLSYFLQPKFTQFLGPVFAAYSGKQSKELHWKKELIETLCTSIKSDFHYVNFNSHPDFDYSLPFNWEGFRLAPRFTYQIQLQNRSLSEIEAEVQKGKIQHKKAAKEGVKFVQVESPEKLLKLFHSLKAQKIKHLKQEDYTRYASALAALDPSFLQITEAHNPEGELVGGIITYQYQGTVVYAFSVSNPEYNHLSIGHALIWECICRAKESGIQMLDFEGSMIPEIERVFRRFGATPTTYHNIQYAKFRFLYRSQ